MGNISRVPFRLTERHPKLKAPLLEIVESAELFLLCGFDFSYAWREARRSIEMDLFTPAPGKPFGEFLDSLAKHPELRFSSAWWSALCSLYETGGPIAETLGALSRHLREERARDIDRFVRLLPLRLHLRLLLFFVPSALFLLFLPMLSGLAQGGFQPR
jgi:hypothetical protein